MTGSRTRALLPLLVTVVVAAVLAAQPSPSLDVVYRETAGRLIGAIDVGGGEMDIGPLMRTGVPGFGLITVNERYFDWHHTSADTFDKVDLQDFRRCIASMAVMAYMLADMPGRL